MIKSCLFIKKSSGKGRGVFTHQAIPAGEIIEVSPVIVMTKEERALLDKTLLHDYIFEWGPEKIQCCMALGYIAVYNHCYASNCEYEMDFKSDLIRIKTIRQVEAGEELLVNYNGTWNDTKPVWFDVK